MKVQKFFLSACVIGAALFCGSDKNTSIAAPLNTAVQARVANSIAQPAWLRERLPEHTVAYVRIPPPWGLFSTPSGRPLDAALVNEQHTKLIAAIRDAVGKDKVMADLGLEPMLKLVLKNLAGPIEVAAIDVSDQFSPGSNLLFTAPLNSKTVAELNADIAALKTTPPLLKKSLNQQGEGKLFSAPAFVKFDKNKQRIYALFSLGTPASSESINILVNSMQTIRPYPFQKSEKGIDASGQGLYVGINTKGWLNAMLSSAWSTTKSGELLQDFAEKTKSYESGWGTIDNRGHWKSQWNAPGSRLLSYLAPSQFKANVMTAGKPQWAITLAIPSAEQYRSFEENLDKDFGESAKNDWQLKMTTMKLLVDFELKDLMGLIGPDVIYFEDSAGTYSAIRVADRKSFYSWLDNASKRFGWKKEVSTSGKAMVHHLFIPGFNPEEIDSSQPRDEKTRSWLTLYSRFGVHSYWVEEGDYLIFGEVPQALADRAAARLDTNIGEWMRKSQSYDPTQVLLGATGVIPNVHRKIYYAYLGGLRMLGDFLGQPVNLMNLPSATELQLPVEGAMGISLDVSKDSVGFSLTYEQTPLEAFMAGGNSVVTSVAVVGILAAVALPAYHDYTLRSDVSDALIEIGDIRTAINKFYMSHQALPSSLAELSQEAEIDVGSASLHGEFLEYKEGAVILGFGEKAKSGFAGTQIVLKPYLLENTLIWQCGYEQIPENAQPLTNTTEKTTLPEKYLPMSCTSSLSISKLN